MPTTTARIAKKTTHAVFQAGTDNAGELVYGASSIRNARSGELWDLYWGGCHVWGFKFNSDSGNTRGWLMENWEPLVSITG
jgi:hypothetical protein